MTFDPMLLLDVILAILLLMLAVIALYGQSLRQSIFMFMVFGLVTALAWARLKAPDVALAEAAIGAGIAGALLLAAFHERQAKPNKCKPKTERPAWQVLTVTYLVIGLFLTVSWAFLDTQTIDAEQNLGVMVQAELEKSGVSNPVTAVLLNFRAYDTLLELAVLFVAVIGVMVFGPARSTPKAAGLVVNQLVSWLTPLLVLVAGYILWVGGHAPGGAFQAGAIVAAAGIIAHLRGTPITFLQGLWLRLLSVSGLGVFLLVGLGVMSSGNPLLQYPDEWAGTLILVIEVFATLSIAASLLLVYVAGHTQSWQLHQDVQDVR